ncbi:MAG: hypothetical protein ACHRHE_23155 [Tepidisphaerales bacterium]
MRANSFTSIERLLAGLPQLGFERAPAGGFRLGDLGLRLNKPWLTLQLPLAPVDSADPLLGWLKRPGLWKFARTPNGLARRFDLPVDAVLLAADDGDSSDVLQSVVGWAIATSAADVSEYRHHGLEARATMAGLRCTANHGQDARATDLVLQHDRYICRGAIINGGRRLAMRMPILRRFRGDLGESRKAWLRELLADAQDRCPMVRLGLDSADAAVDAVVDLTGCPSGLIESVIRTGRDALCWTVAWLVSSVDLLADPSVVSEALQVCPARA